MGINNLAGRDPNGSGSSPSGTGAGQAVSAHSGDDPSREDGTLRSKARALARSVWDEHRKTAVMTFDTIGDEARDIMIDCCLKGMCVGIISGSDLVRDRDASLAEDAPAAEPRSGGSPDPKGIAQDPSTDHQRRR